MSPTLMRIHWLQLKRDRVALGLTFVLPIVFFSIFALIFGGMSSGAGGEAIRVLVADLDASETSRRFLDALDAQGALDLRTAVRESPEAEPRPYSRDDVFERVRAGRAPIGLVVPEGFGATFGAFSGDRAPIELVYDAANPMARPTVEGLLQAAAMQAAPDVLMTRGLEQLETYGGALTPDQQAAVDTIMPFMRGERPWSELDDEDDDASAPNDDGAATNDGAGFTGLVPVEAISAQRDDDGGGDRSIAAYYAAGIGVMFLLFSMTGAAGTLLEEEESGTLERLLTSRQTMASILGSAWAFFAVVGIAQVTLMFLWGALLFGIDLFVPHRLVGFALLTLVTAGAASAFGMLLATLCRSRAQLAGLSTIVILIMSALGGSMVPTFVAPFLEATSRFTFNGWALEGYLRVFWHDDPAAGIGGVLASIALPVAVLVGATVVFLAVARRCARRWEAM